MGNSDSTSISSSLLQGYMEDGRCYATLHSEGEVWCPSDDKSFEVFDLTHIIWVILMFNRPNALFESPIGENAHIVLDIGTGDESWAMDVGDTFPNLSAAIPQGARVLTFEACCAGYGSVSSTYQMDASQLYNRGYVLPEAPNEEVTLILPIVDNAHKMWNWSVKFDPVHLRFLLGPFSARAWRGVYKQAYE